MPEELNNVVDESAEIEVNQENPEAPKYTDKDVDGIVNKKIAKFKSELSAKDREREKAVEEAKRLAQMNAEEQKTYELEQAQKRIQEYEKKEAFYGLSKEASKMLAEHDIQADDGLLAFVVKDDAEATKSAVDSFVALIDAKVAEGVKKALSGTAPKMNIAGNTAMTKEQFNKLPYKDRMELFNTNPTLYNQLK